MELVKISEQPHYLETAATWFAQKWEIPVESYRESLQQSLSTTIPQWYIFLDVGKIIAGAGIIENDFHDRKDLTPNLCALYVEEKYRGQGLAAEILTRVRKDLGAMGIEKVYLVTDLIGFYEQYDWQFLTMVHEESGELIRMYVAETIKGNAAPTVSQQKRI